ncbi:FecR family protein [Pedobacter deserti]|uniref:FecR family protein n=1 Tax=Pedobacter deserti TaxID=2817382 RepID=UPI00210A1500|nr:FecR family protein [Pedobacter sp. SYSU D00382]
MESTPVKQLIEKYLNNALTDQERLQLLELSADKHHPELNGIIREILEKSDETAVDRDRMEASLKRVLETDKAAGLKTPATRKLWWRYAAAAVLLAGLSTYFWFSNIDPRLSEVSKETAQLAEDVLPGGPKAMLTLADGKKIMLDSAADGSLAAQQGIQIVKKDGKVIYAALGTAPEATAYNTLETPRGGTYQLTLPDGTTVLLNAASSITYPVAFTGKERLVEMNGEAYFEVAHNPKKPFKVKINESNTIEVLGTHFNISAYDDEKIMRTTLLEGSVRLHSNATKGILKPGQQAQVTGKQMAIADIGHAGIAEVMAWKDGLFNFQDADLQEIMRDLARWYDIEVVYEKQIPKMEFIGEIERSLPLSAVLKGLKMSGVNFRLEKGKRLVVFP